MSWRLYLPDDKAAVDALHVQLNARLGIEVDIPQLDERPVLISLVYEQKGVITNFVFLEAEAEIQAGGECSLPREEWDKAAKILQEVLDAYRLRIVRACVPQKALERKQSGKPSAIERILKHFGFVREQSDEMAQFYLWNRG